LLREGSGTLVFYTGLGPRLRVRGDGRGVGGDPDGDVLLAAGIALGLAALFPTIPLDAFLEVVPGLLLVPGTDFVIDAAIGVRFYF
jgi:hypothetical protein